MKKNLFVLMIVLALLATVSISAVSAEPTAPIECVLDITYDEYESGVFYWVGTLADCELAGTIRFDAVPEEYADLAKRYTLLKNSPSIHTAGAKSEEKTGVSGTFRLSNSEPTVG